MINNRITEGVGKKIVEALKQQNDSEIEITPVNDPYVQHFEAQASQEINADSLSKSLEEAVASVDSQPSLQNYNQTFNFSQISNPQESFNAGMFSQPVNADLSAVEEMELPSNISVLKQLISRLPSGVSKQTGALIIKQTMEALGISMNSVLQEAQQVQEGINQSARECQNNILEYRKQINILEAKTQKYNKQFAAINDIISLFIQTN